MLLLVPDLHCSLFLLLDLILLTCACQFQEKVIGICLLLLLKSNWYTSTITSEQGMLLFISLISLVTRSER